MHPISVVLTLWQVGSISEKDFQTWVSAELAKADVPESELIDLAYYGPARCLRMSQSNFQFRVLDLTYQDEFALRSIQLDLDDKAGVRRFVNWAAGAAMGRDLDDKLVKFGYLMDHLICDCSDEDAAISYAKENLPLLKPHFPRYAHEILAAVPELTW